MDCREAFIALNMIDGIGPVRVRQLLERFGDSTAILRASPAELQQVHGIGPELSEAIANWEKTGTSPANYNASGNPAAKSSSSPTRIIPRCSGKSTIRRCSFT